MAARLPSILFVAHGFPPDQMAGAEVYTWGLARELAARGHGVTVLAPAVRPGHAELELVEESSDGLRGLRPQLLAENLTAMIADAQEGFTAFLEKRHPNFTS